MARLDLTALHGSLTDPVLGSLGFLNEVMGRYPEAVSFAPGAPHPVFFDEFDPQRYTDRFVEHLVTARGHTPESARRLLFEYGPSRGLINDLIAEGLRRDDGIDVDPASIVVTVGAQEAMLLVLRALFRSRSDVLAVANPCFVGITGAARLLDVPVVGIDEGPGGLDLAELQKLCRTARLAGGRVRAIYVAPDFANPGGGQMSATGRRDLLDLAVREDFLVLEDNAYGFTCAPGDELPPLKALDTTGHVVSIGTFAKICFPGARVGYVVADQPVRDAETGRVQPLADHLAAVKTMVTVNTSPLCQAVIGGMLLEHGGSLAALGRRKTALYQRNLTHLREALDRDLPDAADLGISWNRPDGGFFLRMHLPVRVDADLLELSAAKYGVLWTPMAQFYLDGGGDRQLRLSCSYLDPEQIDLGVRRLATFLRKEIGS